MKSPSIGYVVRLCCQTLDLSLTLDSIKSQKVRDHQSDICSHSFVLVLVLNTKISYLSQDKLLCVIFCFLYFRSKLCFSYKAGSLVILFEKAYVNRVHFVCLRMTAIKTKRPIVVPVKIQVIKYLL